MSVIFILGIVTLALGGFFLLAPERVSGMKNTLEQVMNKRLGNVGEDLVQSRVWVGTVLIVAGILMMSQWFMHD